MELFGLTIIITFNKSLWSNPIKSIDIDFLLWIYCIFGEFLIEYVKWNFLAQQIISIDIDWLLVVN